MVQMIAPRRHPRTGIHHRRKELPPHLRDEPGRRQVRRPLRTRDPAKARRSSSVPMPNSSRRRRRPKPGSPRRTSRMKSRPSGKGSSSTTSAAPGIRRVSGRAGPRWACLVAAGHRPARPQHRLSPRRRPSDGRQPGSPTRQLLARCRPDVPGGGMTESGQLGSSRHVRGTVSADQAHPSRRPNRYVNAVVRTAHRCRVDRTR